MLVFNETKFAYDRNKMHWRLGPPVLNKDVIYKHLGVSYNNYLSIDINFKGAAKKK